MTASSDNGAASSDSALQQRLDAQSLENIGLLSEQLRSPLGTLPFVGAGLSGPFKFPQWGTLLRELARDIPREAREQVEIAVSAQEYTRAATIVAHHFDETAFQTAIALRFPDGQLERVEISKTAVELVPYLTSGLVVTTNFDGVLEHVFERSGARFSNVVCGANPTQVMPAIQQNRWVLWKIHGDRNDPRTRVLSTEDYETHYRQLDNLLSLALSNRPALFLGCSLDKDRTVDVLRAVQKVHPGLMHFALLAAPATEAAFDARIGELRSLGVRPIWFMPDADFAPLRERLLKLIQRSSARSAKVPPGFKPDQVKVGPGVTTAARVALTAELSDLAHGVLAQERIARERGEPIEKEDKPPFPAIIDRIVRGDVVFFLGAGALLGRLPLAREFYGKLRALVDAPNELSNERMTQHYVDVYGRPGLDTKLRELLDGDPVDPTALHWLLGTLTSSLQAKGHHPRAPIVMTTNFDQTMERVFDYMGQRYHLFTYRLTPPHEGQFVYRTPDGEILAVDRPERFRHELENCPVVVKYHGGLHRADPLPMTYALTECDFVHTAKHLPAVLPRVVRDRILQSTLLFLGSGLRAQCVEALAREVSYAQPRQRSWAIQRFPAPGWPLYWSKLGVDILDIRLERFVLELAEELEQVRDVSRS